MGIKVVYVICTLWGECLTDLPRGCLCKLNLGAVMKFQVLGVLGLEVEGELLAPTAPKPRSVLAVLMQHRNHSVPTGWLIEELWGDSSPSSALATLQTYIYQLRKFLTAAVGPDRKSVV